MGRKRTAWVAALIGLASCQQKNNNQERLFLNNYSACVRVGPILFDAHKEKDAYKGSLMRESLANYIYDMNIDLEFRHLKINDIYDVYCNEIFIGRYTIAPGEITDYKTNKDPTVIN